MPKKKHLNKTKRAHPNKDKTIGQQSYSDIEKSVFRSLNNQFYGNPFGVIEIDRSLYNIKRVEK